MEILTCSGARLVGESSCSEQGSEIVLKHDEKPDCIQDAEQVRTDVGIDGVTLSVGESHYMREGEDQFVFEGFPTSDEGCNVEMCSDFEADGQNPLCYSHDSEYENLDKRDDFEETGLTLENSHPVLENNLEGSSHSEIKSLGHDEPQAVWVKV